MEARRPVRAAILLASLMAAFIVYGSLYPFSFQPLAPGLSLLQAVANAWELRYSGRGDMAANLLLYAPLALALSLAFARLRPWPAAVLALLLCALLSASMEFAQLFAPRRVASGGDLALNTIGAGFGALAGTLMAPRRAADALRWRPTLAEVFPALLLACWLGYRLYPYVPAFDLGEWKASLKPLLLPFAPDPLRTLRLALLWLVAARMLDAALPRGAGGVLAAALMLGTVGAAVPLFGRILTFEEILAVAVAAPAWALLRRLPAPWLDRLLLPGLLAAVALEGLAPYRMLDTPRPFGWIPFRSLVNGQLGFGLQAVLYKAFQYGGLGWLAMRAGLPMPLAAGFAVLAAFAISLAQTWLPGRSAEITDAVLATAATLVLWLAPHPHRGGR
jgi:VanZ family protein